jgi:AmmeMemoRadiSam system protein B
MDKPRIRSVEAFPVEHENERLICLRDPLGFAPQPILVGLGAYFLITLFDGDHSHLDIQEAYAKRFGDLLVSERLAELITNLDRALFLESPAFAERMAQIKTEFHDAPTREAVHAGLCYEREPLKLRAELGAYFDPPAGPGRSNQSRGGSTPAGLIAPHIDPRRGGPAYAHAYSELMGREPAERFIILGTSHYGAGPELFTSTCKNYATPFGDVQTDVEFVKRLAARYRGGDLFAEELLHRSEHSIEFQTLFLAWSLGTRGYQVVPILVSSFHEMVRSRTMPSSDARVAGFLEALRAEMASDECRTCIIAGVDFAHVGKKFGDDTGVDEAFLEAVRHEDLELIESIKRGDPDGFFASISEDQDRRRICGLSPMYTQLELLRTHQGRLLKYDVCVEEPTQSAVSFASLAID